MTERKEERGFVDKVKDMFHIGEKKDTTLHSRENNFEKPSVSTLEDNKRRDVFQDKPFVSTVDPTTYKYDKPFSTTVDPSNNTREFYDRPFNDTASTTSAPMQSKNIVGIGEIESELQQAKTNIMQNPPNNVPLNNNPIFDEFGVGKSWNDDKNRNLESTNRWNENK